jgi:two-component system sensor histidine kinase YesM
MKKIIAFFKNLSIVVKFTLIIVLAFILLSGSILISANLYEKERLATYYGIHSSNNAQLLDKIDSYIADISNVTKIPLTYKINDSTYMSLLSDFNEAGDNSYEFQRQNEQIFEQIMTYKSEVNSCYIFNTKGEADYKVKYAIYSPFDPSDTYWFKEAIERFGKPVLVKTYELPGIVNENLRPVYVFGIARGIVQLKSGSVIGILLVNTEVKYLEKLCSEVSLGKNQRFLIMSGSHCIYDTMGKFTSMSIPSDNAIMSIPEETIGTFFKCNIDHRLSYATSLSSDSFGLRVISIAPSDDLLEGLTRIQFTNFIQLILIIFAILLITLFALRKVVSPLTLLSSMMKMAEDGDFTNHVKFDSLDEVGKLAESYNSLIDKINSLIKEVYLERINANELELQMLQSQINPHFLYNTLESISMMATINDDDVTSDMAASLGSILRYSISDLNAPVSLLDEITHIKEYVALLEYRFKNQYRLDVDVPVSLYPAQMPKLILQPVVENAIYHGMRTIRTGGVIKVTASKVTRGLFEIRVLDNGSGISEDELKLLNDYINEKNDSFDSIGLRNVNRRILLFCKEEKASSDVGVIVERGDNGGTCVRILIKDMS